MESLCKNKEDGKLLFSIWAFFASREFGNQFFFFPPAEGVFTRAGEGFIHPFSKLLEKKIPSAVEEGESEIKNPKCQKLRERASSMM